MSTFRRNRKARRANLVELLFRLEQRPSPEELVELIGEVLDWFREHPDETDLRRLFAELISRTFIESGIPGPIPEDLLEMKTNLEGLVKTWKKQWRAEAMAEGRAVGRAKGRAEGKTDGLSEALVCVLTGKFGEVTPSVRERIRAANLATLKRWLKRAIAAPDLPSVFAQPR
jgi:hypothetical protein